MNHRGCLALVLHAHLPFVRHPEVDRFLEENWLFEAVAEVYLPLLERMDGWRRDGMDWRLTLTLSPTLCGMLTDSLLQDRCQRYLEERIELAGKEVHRTHWEPAVHNLAMMYHERFRRLHDRFLDCGRDLVGAFRRHQETGHLEVVACAATHALLPFLASHPPSLRAQIATGCDAYREGFHCEPRGFWLPECAYGEGIDAALKDGGLRWTITDSHGLLHASPQPRHGLLAPVTTSEGMVVFGRDHESARQVWSQQEGYPGDPRYRDFYRDIGYDLDLDYIGPYLCSPECRSFTGIKYHAITGTGDKRHYDPKAARQAAADHAAHFIEARQRQVAACEPMDGPPILVCPYDAELFGHWWFEGVDFLDMLVRNLAFEQDTLKLVTPTEYLEGHPGPEAATPGSSSWGDHGYFSMWLNETNDWIYPHLNQAQDRMSRLVTLHANPDRLMRRALQQAGRELLLAQSSDWAFIMRTGSHAGYARQRVNDHLVQFNTLAQALEQGMVNEHLLREREEQWNIFPKLELNHWKGC